MTTNVIALVGVVCGILSIAMSLTPIIVKRRREAASKKFWAQSDRIADDLQKFPMGPFAWITPALNKAGHWVISTQTRKGSPIADFTITDAELEAVADWAKGHFERRRKYIAERDET